VLNCGSGDSGLTFLCDRSNYDRQSLFLDSLSRLTPESFASNLVLSPDGRFLYVVDQGNWQVVVIDSATRERIASVPTGVNPLAMARDAMDSGKLGSATRILAQAAKEVGENDKRRKHDQNEPWTSEFSDLTMAELDQRIAATAAKLGLGLVPLPGADIGKPAGREGEAVEPPHDRDPLSR